MGSYAFFTKAKGENAEKAFAAANSDARWESGNGGYTGTITEKHDFIMIELPKGYKEAHQTTSKWDMAELEYAEHLITEGDPRIDDKWGPAGCIKITEGEYLFFGWASC